METRWLQARGEPHAGTLWLRSNSYFGATRAIEITTRAIISAVADAARSFVALLNADDIVASGALAFSVTQVDSSGMVIKGAAGVIFYPKIYHSAETVVTCDISYDAMSDNHAGQCLLPALLAGAFSLEVRDGSNALIGNTNLSVFVSNCPLTYYFSNFTNMCECAPGLYDTGSACFRCAPGTFSTGGDNECLECTWPETSNEGESECSLCAIGYYRAFPANRGGGRELWAAAGQDIQDDETCRPCPSEASCDDNSREASINDGYWVAGTAWTEIYQCPFGELACTDGVCNDAYQGPKCAACIEGYYISSLDVSRCKSCPRGANIGVAVALVLSTVLILGAVLSPTVFAARAARKQKYGSALHYLRMKKASQFFDIAKFKILWASFQSEIK